MSTEHDVIDSAGTEEILREVRRPGLIATHRGLVEELDAGIMANMIDGTSTHPRVLSMLKELDEPHSVQRVTASLTTLAEESGSATVRHALLDHLALMRGERGIEIAKLQHHAIGVYRHLRQALTIRQGQSPDLDEIRQLPTSQLTRLLAGRQASFGSVDLRDDLVCTPAAFARSNQALQRLLRPTEQSQFWDDADGPPPLPRKVEEPLLTLPKEEQEAARTLAIRDRIRSRFFRAVFLQYFAADELDIAGAGYATVLDWLLAIEETPHLFPFMQGQTPQQKSFRLARLTEKLLQMHEMYARADHYAGQDAWRETLRTLATRDRLARLAQARVPALPLGRDTTVAVALLPFADLASWIQARVAADDFILPPDPRR